jgi:hypothetical protein
MVASACILWTRSPYRLLVEQLADEVHQSRRRSSVGDGLGTEQKRNRFGVRGSGCDEPCLEHVRVVESCELQALNGFAFARW